VAASTKARAPTARSLVNVQIAAEASTKARAPTARSLVNVQIAADDDVPGIAVEHLAEHLFN